MLKGNSKGLPDVVEVHRRQFVLGKSGFRPTSFWHSMEVCNGYTLSWHQDLEITVARTGLNVTVVLGIIVDPACPNRSAAEIASRVNSSPCANSALASTSGYSGRWVVLFFTEVEQIAFTDPCGFRSLFFCETSESLWIGAQPALLARVCSLQPNKNCSYIEFVQHPRFKKRESALIGSATQLSNCYRLLPNHVLIINRRATRRWFPSDQLDSLETDVAVKRSATLLKGTIASLSNRYAIDLPLTAGWDSRVILAAARDDISDICIYVDRMGILSEQHSDVIVPKEICKKIDVEFNIINSLEEVPDWFCDFIRMNVGMYRELPKLRTVFAKYKQGQIRVNVNGNGSEIVRNTLDRFGSLNQNALSPEELCHLLNCPPTKFALNAIHEWMSGAKAAAALGYNVLDLLYWEQQMACWSALYPAEQDIAVDEVSPFNNREYIRTMLAVKVRDRLSPDYLAYRRLLDALWPDLARWPCNPGRQKLVNSLARRMPLSIRRYVTLKYHI